jgi:4'-phosphopantetheinyl transferase
MPTRDSAVQPPHADGDLSWPLPPCDFSLGEDEIHVWASRLDPGAATLLEYSATLAREEQERAERFHFDRDRNRFIAGRGFLRAVLSRYLREPPEEIAFVYGPFGKPSLAAAFAMADLQFNLAHCEDIAVLAVTRRGEAGIDVERVRPVPDAEQLVARFFSARESAAFHRLPLSDRPTAFFNLWTRKEAWLKATGEGIGHSLSVVEVSFLPGEQARLLSIASSYAEASRWELQEFSPVAGFVGALAASTPGKQVKCWRWAKKGTFLS